MPKAPKENLCGQLKEIVSQAGCPAFRQTNSVRTLALGNLKSLYQAVDAASESAMLYPAYDCGYSVQTLAYRQVVPWVLYLFQLPAVVHLGVRLAPA